MLTEQTQKTTNFINFQTSLPLDKILCVLQKKRKHLGIQMVYHMYFQKCNKYVLE